MAAARTLASADPGPADVDDPLTGELGILPRPDGSDSTELSITVTDLRLNDGRPTNIPLLVKGQVDVEKLLAGARGTPAQEEIAVRRAIERSKATPLPSYETIEEAVEAAKARSRAGGSRRKFAPGPGAVSEETPPRLASGQPLESASADVMAPPKVPAGMMPLAEYLRLVAEGGTRGRKIQTPAGETLLDDVIRDGSQAFLRHLKGETAGAPAGSKPFLPNTLTDAAPIHRQLEGQEEAFPETFYADQLVPRPGEAVSPRERERVGEEIRMDERRRSLVFPPETS